MKEFDFTTVPRYKFYGFAAALARPILKLIFRIKIEGTENVPKKGGLVLASNHISELDPVIVAIYLKRRVHFMAKAELFQRPLLRSIVTHLSAFPVNRGKGDTTAIDYSIKLIQEGHVLGIFPEGTRSKTGRPGKAKSGVVLIASKTGADVVPCAIVTKNGKIRPFRKITIRYGKPIPNSKIHIVENKTSELRASSAMIMDSITELLETQEKE